MADSVILFQQNKITSMSMNAHIINKKRTLKKVLLYGGREETRTPMPKALDPKSSASTNFATRPYSYLSAILGFFYLIVNLFWLMRLPPLSKKDI